MCGTANENNAASCKYCGYIFENFNSGMITPSATSSPPPQKEEQPQSSFNATPPQTVSDSFGTTTTPSSTVSTGSPLFVVSRSIVTTTIVPAVFYFFFILLLGGISGFNLTAIIYIVFFILITIVPALVTPRKYEFFDNSLRIHKIIGGDSEFSYDSMKFREYSMSRRPQTFLYVSGRKRPIVITGNPTNKELGQNLNQFLESKLKRYDPKLDDAQVTAPDTPSTDENAGTSM